MRRLLTGYAVSFNHRHQRSGHLFQNRYKSIVCEEEPYLLELVRYIHLHPLRAGLVANLHELDRYPWSGHAVLLSNRQFAGQDTAAILERFARDLTEARQNYSLFIADGVSAGRRDDLLGGGLKRSHGERADNANESFDERVLGGGDFVDRLKQDCNLQERMKRTVTLEKLLVAVAAALNVEPDSVVKPGKSRAPAAARAIICHLAIYRFGYTGSEVGAFLHLGPTGVSLASRRGEKILKADFTLLKSIMDAIEK